MDIVLSMMVGVWLGWVLNIKKDFFRLYNPSNYSFKAKRIYKRIT